MTEFCSFPQAVESLCALARAGRSALVIGPAASGKTTLLGAVRERLESEGIPTATVHGWSPKRLMRDLRFREEAGLCVIGDDLPLRQALELPAPGAVIAAVADIHSLEDLPKGSVSDAARRKFAAAAVLERRGAFSEPSVVLAEW